MLVLTRKHGERIQIGPDIVVYLIRSTKTHAVIGIEAPTDLRIIRKDGDDEQTTRVE